MHWDNFKETHMWEKGLMQMITPPGNGFFRELVKESLSKVASSKILKWGKSLTPRQFRKCSGSLVIT